MNNIDIVQKQSIILDPNGQRENSVRSSVNNIYRWNTVEAGCIEFSIVNIAYMRYINPENGDYDIQLTNKTMSTESKSISCTGYDLGLKLECTGGILRFIGTIDGTQRDVIISAGNCIECYSSIEGQIYASIDPSSTGQLSYDKYTCATAYCGFAVKALNRVEDTIEEDFYEASPYKHVYVDNGDTPTPEPTPDPGE